jgi:hypothetical protein
MNTNIKSDNNNNKYKSNNKINLYKENLIKFIIGQKEKIIPIGSIESIDYIIGVLFLTESNRYFKQNKINSHGYYLAYTFINLFNKIRLKMLKSYRFDYHDINHFIIALSSNIDYFNSRIDPTNITKNKINNNLSKFQMEILPILTNLVEYNKKHNDTKEIIDKNYNLSSEISNQDNNLTVNQDNNISVNQDYMINECNNIDTNITITNKEINIKKLNKTLNKINKCENKFCDIECYSCWVPNILSKFFYLLLQTAKFVGTGMTSDPNLIRLSEYYANIFYTWFKSNDIIYMNCSNPNIHTELYENYLNYKNKLNYSLIELELGSETLDEIINYIDNEIIDNLSIKIK